MIKIHCNFDKNKRLRYFFILFPVFLIAASVIFINCAFSAFHILNNNGADKTTQPQNDFWQYYKLSFFNKLPKGTILVDPHAKLALSEAMGHGLIFAAEREDWKAFDSLIDGLKYFHKENGLFRWKINADGSTPPEEINLSSASESEQNIAYSLLLAFEKTNKLKYKDAGLTLLNYIWNNYVRSFQNKLIFLPADINPYWPIIFNKDNSINKLAWNPSYFSPKLYRKFSKYDNKHNWDKVIIDGYCLMNMVINNAKVHPKEFGINGINPMPAWVWLIPAGQNKIKVANFYPRKINHNTYEESSNEWDAIRIPIYIAMDKENIEGRNFLKLFYDITKIKAPKDAIIGEERYNNMIAIAAYAAGLKVLGKNVDPFLQKMQIDKKGFNTEIRNSYYDQTICYYAWLLLNNRFPF